MRLSTIINHGKRTAKYHFELKKRVDFPEELVERHFKSWSDINHVNFSLFKIIVRELAGRPAFILETGTSAYGTDSTRFWNSYIKKFGGKVISVDIRKDAGILLKYNLSKKTELVTSDSVEYLQNHHFGYVDLYYFDSADVNWASPEFSMNHGLAELLAVVDKLEAGQIVVFDDTPKSELYVENHLKHFVLEFFEKNGFFPGKGSLAQKILEEKFDLKVLHHEYAYACKIIRLKTND